MWLEDEDPNNSSQVSDDIVDLVFKMDCRSLPIDHAEKLYLSIQEILDLNQHPVAIHQIHVAESSNGWNRPEEKDAILLPSKRTRLVIRSPQYSLNHIRQLTGNTLRIDDHELKIRKSSIRLLNSLTTLFARHVETSNNESDDAFIQRCQQNLRNRGYQFKKMMSGRMVPHTINNKEIVTRKLMVAGFNVADAIRLQQEGIGNWQHYGFGIFMPHKGIDPVNGG